MPMRRVLIVAYHYPPVAGSSGVQRTLKFSTYLRELGWEPLILTVNPRAYERATDGQLAEIPAGVRVERAFALDSARHLSIFGYFPARLAMPDRWCSWWFDGVRRGLRLIREHRPDALMSTFPIATAHMIARSLQRTTGLPWLADFRDHMTDPDYPPDPAIWRFNRRLESDTVHACSKAIFTTSGALQMYAQRYADLPASRWAIIENGFDEENFRDAERAARPPATAGGPLRLIHSGILYPHERDPRCFFAALERLKASGVLNASNVRFVLRATASDDVYRPILAKARIDDIVELAPPVDYREALKEMLHADGLLLFQAALANQQIPAKLYEYMRAGRPILALTDPAGDTAAAMRASHTGMICDLANVNDIAAKLTAFIDGVRTGTLAGTERQLADLHSRRARTVDLAACLNGVVEGQRERTVSTGLAGT
ncbi:MAG: glycosyltransferase [Burkholderiaceae bacterium]|nr:glycosyltransferase [Burkholderiaceae bacterium]